MLTPPAIYGVLQAAPLVAGPDANPYKPVWMLSWELSHPRDRVRYAAADELTDRYSTGSLKGGALRSALGGVLDQQRAGLAWDSKAGDLFEQAYLDAKVADDLWSEFAFNAIGPIEVRLRNRVHSGDPVRMSWSLTPLGEFNRSRNPRYYMQRPSGTLGTVCFAAELIRVNVLGQGEVELGDDRAAQHATAIRPMFMFGGIMEPGPLLPELMPRRQITRLDAPIGVVEMVLTYRVRVVHPGTGETIATRNVQARAATRVIPDDRPILPLRTSPNDADRVRGAFDMESVEFRDSWEKDKIHVLLSGFEYGWPEATEVTGGAFRIEIEFDAQARVVDTPLPARLVVDGSNVRVIDGRGGGASLGGDIQLSPGDVSRLIYWSEPESARVFLVPDPETMTRYPLDLPESIWGETIDLGEFPVRWVDSD